MDKFEKRKEVIASLENAPKDTILSQILEKKKTKSIELDFTEALEGKVNLAILMEKGFNAVEILRFSPGNITSLLNLPPNLKKLVIADNLLDTVELPDSIEYVDIAHNALKGEVDLGRNELLIYLRVSYNQITSLENLSTNLEEIYCDHNLLRSLNLKNTPKLRILHCNYNPNLILHHLPDTLVESRLPEKRVQQTKSDGTTKEYLDSLHKYFNLKQKYEKSLMDMKIAAKKRKRTLKTLPPCIGCSMPVGMVFSGKDQKYAAYCGDSTKPCDWKLVIYRGDHYPFVDTLMEMRENLEETKQNIIRQKMDTLFEYITEQKSTSLFKNQLSFLTTNTEMVEKYLEDYHRIYFSLEKREIVELKQKNIQQLLLELQEYYVEGEMEEVVRIQYTKVQPIAKYIQSLHYPLMEMEFDKKKGEWTLDQREMLLTDIEINHGEPVSVKTVMKMTPETETPKKTTVKSKKQSMEDSDFFNKTPEGDIFSEDDDED
jgi:hypothetical protein